MSQQSIARGGYYNSRNPPPSHEVALSRISELELVTQNIETQLEFSNPNEFDTDEAHAGWKRRSTRALTYYRNELHFLRRWLRGGKPPSSSDERYRTALENITTSVRRMTELMKDAYKRVYVEGHMPSNLAVARKRSLEIVPLIQRCTGLFADLKKQAEEGEIGDDTMVKLRRPLSRLYMDMMAERKLLNEFMREQRGERVDWTLFLISLVERGIEAGLVLTQEETDILEEIHVAKLAQLPAASTSQ